MSTDLDAVPGRTDARGPAPDEDMLLDEQLCFALYAASRAITARYRPLLDELHLTYPQYLVMLVLWETGPITVSELGRRLHLDSGTLSPLLKRLEIAELVERERRTDDERSVQVVLTPDGVALKERARCVPTAMGSAMGLDAAARRKLGRQLNRLADAVTSDL